MPKGELNAKILVTGGTGFLGGSLIRQLARDGHQVFALTRSSASHAKLRALGAYPIDVDLESEAPLSLPTIDAVVHAAALFRFSGPREPFFRTNVDGTSRLLVSVENAGARFRSPCGTPFRRRNENDGAPSGRSAHLKSKS